MPRWKRWTSRTHAAVAQPVDGLWCSFVPADFVDLPAALTRWRAVLCPGGWIALVEIDDLFAHVPLAARRREIFDAYAARALALGAYDFHMGRKLEGCLRQAGFHVDRAGTLPDLEFCFDGPARPDVLDGWRRRLDRLGLLQQIVGPDARAVRDDFLACLSRSDHRSNARVCWALAHT